VGEEELILLDTDVIIEVLDKKSDKGQALMLKIMESGEGYCTSSVNMHEVLYGIDKYSKDSHLVLQIPTMVYSKNDSELSAALELNAERRGKICSENGCDCGINRNKQWMFTLHFR
jgi:Predicted nucleic acid-binding protein, contains PIN domain